MIILKISSVRFGYTSPHQAQSPSAHSESIIAHAVMCARFTSKSQKLPTMKTNISPEQNKFATIFLFTVQSG